MNNIPDRFKGISKDLLDAYIIIIECMESMRGSVKTIDYYKQLDVKRKEIHQLLADTAKVAKTDPDFTLWLAHYVEDVLRK